MCLLFLYLAEKPSPDQYAVILVNNRDEVWDRPTKPAGFWGTDSNYISGLDAEPGREGGTWLGLSKQGKIGSLTNILSSHNDSSKKGRGFLVADYLTSASPDSQTYLQKLSSEGTLYNGFNIILLDIWPGFKFNLNFYSNWTEFYKEPINIPAPGIHGFGNCRLDPAWKKVDAGKVAMSKIVSVYNSVEKKEELLKSLLDLLGDNTRHLPDEWLEKQGEHLAEDLRLERSAINVWSPRYRYGTRTNTIVLIDGAGNCDYVERTMRPPLDAFPRDPQSVVWLTTRHSFKMDLAEMSASL